MEEPRVETETSEMLPEVITPASAPMKLEQMSEMIGYMEEFIKSLLKPEVDFGIIPGTQKPSLYKAGAEKLCMAFGLAEKYKILESNREPFKEWKHGKDKNVRGYYHYCVRCELIHKGTGIVWASSIGDCESTERGRETAPSNTILKMAQKRAFVGATLHATFTSDRFTADMDTYERPASKEQPKGKPASAPADGKGFRMPFGKHKGELIAEVPKPYLQWCLENMESLHDDTRKVIEAAIVGEGNKKPEPPTEPEQKADPTREALLKEIPELETQYGTIKKDFKPLEARENLLGIHALTTAENDELVRYWNLLTSKISEANA